MISIDTLRQKCIEKMKEILPKKKEDTPNGTPSNHFIMVDPEQPNKLLITLVLNPSTEESQILKTDGAEMSFAQLKTLSQLLLDLGFISQEQD